MGYNSVVMICNDAMGEIDKDPAGWWRKAKEKLMTLNREDGTFGHGNHGGCFQAVWNQHADDVGVILVGGNYATVVGRAWGSHASKQSEDKILEEIMRERGYVVYRKKT